MRRIGLLAIAVVAIASALGFSGRAEAATIHCGAWQHCVGTDAGDSIYCDASPCWIQGGNGPDYIRGNGGDDTLEGNGGADLVIAGKGNDRLQGNTGNDQLDGAFGCRGKLYDGGDGTDDVAIFSYFASVGGENVFRENERYRIGFEC